MAVDKVPELIDDVPVMKVRGHEIDMFKVRTATTTYPGIGVEMEWNKRTPSSTGT